MIRLSGATMRYGGRVLFSDLDWLITPKDRVGVVGGNGAGKSTLLKILCGVEHLDIGEIESQKGIRIGVLASGGLGAIWTHCVQGVPQCLRVKRWRWKRNSKS